MENKIENYVLCEYLGDSVYIAINENTNQLFIFTYNGGPGTLINEICLEDDTLINFFRVIRKFGFKDQINLDGTLR